MFTYVRAYNFNNHRVLGFWATKTPCQDFEQMILMGQAISFYDHKTDKQIIIPAAACANLFFEVSEK